MIKFGDNVCGDAVGCPLRLAVSEDDKHESHHFTDVDASIRNILSEWRVDASGRESTSSTPEAGLVVRTWLAAKEVTTTIGFETALPFSRDPAAVGSAREQKSSTLSRLTSAHRARDSLAVASVERVHDHTSAADEAPAAKPTPPIDAGTCVAVAPAVAAIE